MDGEKEGGIERGNYNILYLDKTDHSLENRSSFRSASSTAALSSVACLI